MARYGGGERPQPLNTPGLPAADAARAKAELEILQEMAEAAGGRKEGDRQIKRVRGKETRYSKGVGRAESGEEVFGERDLINQRRAAMEMQRQEQMLAMEQNRALAEAGVAPLTQVQDVVNAATGANLDPETAMRVAQLSEVLKPPPKGLSFRSSSAIGSATKPGLKVLERAPPVAALLGACGARAWGS